MSESAKQSCRPPVNLKGLQERVLVSASLMRLNAQLRNFTPLRDRLVAHGQDANAAYVRSSRGVTASWPNSRNSPRPRSPPPKCFRPPPAVVTKRNYLWLAADKSQDTRKPSAPGNNKHVDWSYLVISSSCVRIPTVA
jgi:hypothetical protein